MVNPDDLDKVLEHARALLHDGWERWPGGYPDAIELALLDAVFSIRARYGRVSGPGHLRPTGVPAVIDQWRNFRPQQGCDDLTHITDTNRADLASFLNNSSRTSGRLKAEVVWEAAAALTAAGIRTAGDFRAERDTAKAAYLGIRGIGWVTFSYLCMLLQVPDVKADTWITRFVSDATNRQCAACEAYDLVHAAAKRFAANGEEMPADPSSLDHAIWAASRIRSGVSTPGPRTKRDG